MIKAVIFDMYETLITHYNCPLYFGAQMAKDAGISEDEFQKLWRPTEYDRSIGKLRLEEVIEMILKENNCYSKELLKTIVDKRIAVKEARILIKIKAIFVPDKQIYTICFKIC
jgi:putative hydrolase of the HAD superfamily